MLAALTGYNEGAVKYVDGVVAKLPEYPGADSHMSYLGRAVNALGKVRQASPTSPHTPGPGALAAAAKLQVILVTGIEGFEELLVLGVGELQEPKSVEVSPGCEAWSCCCFRA